MGVSDTCLQAKVKISYIKKEYTLRNRYMHDRYSNEPFPMCG